MSKRIFIGKHSSPQTGERMLFRMTPPGYDADNLTHPAVFSSDNDYLKLHATFNFDVERYSQDGKNYYRGDVGFPDLGYVPVTFISVSYLDRIFFPNDRADKTTEMNDFFQFAVSSNHLWITSSGGTGSSYDFKCRALVFKNRLDQSF